MGRPFFNHGIDAWWSSFVGLFIQKEIDTVNTPLRRNRGAVLKSWQMVQLMDCSCTCILWIW